MRRGLSLQTSLASYAVIGGALSLAGWAVDIPRLTDWFNTGVSIQPNTALATTLAGIALLLLDRGRRAPAALMGALVAAIGASVVVEYAINIDLGVDEILLFGREWGRGSVTLPGRMGHPAANSFCLIGTAVLIGSLIPADHLYRRLRVLVPTLAGLSTIGSSLAIVGYIYGATAFYAIPAATAIALQTATCILAVSLGLILSVRDFGPARLLTEQSTAGALLRRTLPALVLIPVVLGWLRLFGQRGGYFDLEFGTAARTVTEIVLLIALIWWVARDVSAEERQRRAAEAKLIEHERLLRTVTEEAQIGLVIVGRDHRYLYANRAYCDIVRVNPEGIVGRHPQDVLPDVYETRIRPKIDAALRGETVRYELELPERGQFVSVTYQPQFTGDVITSCIVAIVDTTERRRIEETLTASRHELQEGARRKDEFLVMLAHELRNPLAPIRTAVELLNRAPSEKDAAWARGVIDRQLGLMVHLLDDLLDVGRIARDKLTLRMEPIDLVKIIRDSLEMNRSLADLAHQQLHFSASRESIFMLGDQARVQQVVANLLSNACRYSGDRPGRIDVRIDSVGDTAVVSVKDTGIGIPPHELQRIFEMFSQLDRSMERLQGGLGIGLHLVKRLVEMHGGRVEARSDGPGRGSEFVITLPTIDVDLAIAASARATDASRTTPETTGLRVLVVDDNSDGADALVLLLESIGHEPHVAYDGPAAIAAANQLQPDVILLDIGMPGMNGHDACRAIRHTRVGPQPMIVALTGWGQHSDRQKSQAAGFDHHLVKPVDFDALIALLNSRARTISSTVSAPPQ